MKDIVAATVLVIFSTTCLAAMIAWGFLAYNVLRLFILSRKLNLEGHLRINPLNVIFYPEFLSKEGLEIRRRIFRSAIWLVGLIAFGFLLGGVAYVVGPEIR